ncbi:MAG: hypothetical protein GXO43_06940 [Crenarchaeota archaeon]|nr:hypothetical protein [Thermoproteota archaeon]
MSFTDIYLRPCSECNKFLDENIARLIYDRLGAKILEAVCNAIDNAYSEGYDKCEDENLEDYDYEEEED